VTERDLRRTVGYAMTTYGELAMIRRVVDRLTSDPSTAGVAIHHDADSGPLDLEFARPDLVTVVPRPVAVQWGNWTQVEALMSAVELVCRTFGSTQWVVTLSGQDYPAMPLGQIAAFLAESEWDAYVESRPVSTRFEGSARWRYGYRYYRVPSVIGPTMARRLGQVISKCPALFSGAWWFPEKHGNFLAIRNPKAKVGDLLGGSDWIVLNRSAVEHLTSRFTMPEVRREWSRTMIPSEAFYATELAKTPVRVYPESLRFADFVPPSSAHPRVLQLRDAPAIKASGALFARKVDPVVSADLLDLLDLDQGAQTAPVRPAERHTASRTVD
jgi:hypothetical protein